MQRVKEGHKALAESSVKLALKNFQEKLPYTDTPYSKRNWGHPLHSLCSYQGKLKPAQAHWLIKSFTSIGDHVLDPLGGVGTIAFEAGMLGRQSTSIDINPFPNAIASAKMDPPTLAQALGGVSDFIGAAQSCLVSDADMQSAQFGLNARVVDYYHPDTLLEVLRARRYFNSQKTLTQTERFYKACILHILHGNRPYALSRTSHPITPFAPRGPFEYRSLESSLREKIARALAPLPDNYVRGQSILGDFRNASMDMQRPADVVITSPPFVGMRFDRPNWLRLWFCGWNESDFKTVSLGSLDRQQSKNLGVYREFFGTCAEVTNKSALLLIHVGGSKAYNMIEALRQHAQPYFTFSGQIDEDVSQIERHGISDKGQTTQNHVLAFEKR